MSHDETPLQHDLVVHTHGCINNREYVPNVIVLHQAAPDPKLDHYSDPKSTANVLQGY